MTRRRPSRDERRDIEYGERVARTLAGMDLGQTAVVKDRAAVALEAMEGTDETVRRAGRIAGPGTTIVKVSKPQQDPRFDVPVVGPGTLLAWRKQARALLALDTGCALLIDKAEFLSRAGPRGRGRVGSAATDAGGGGSPCLDHSVLVGVIVLGRSVDTTPAYGRRPRARPSWAYATPKPHGCGGGGAARCRAFPDMQSRLGRGPRVSVAVPTAHHMRSPASRSSVVGTCWSRSPSPRRWSRRTS